MKTITKDINNESGIALLIAISIVSLLTVLILEFMYATRVEINIAALSRDRLNAYYAARGGILYALNVLQQDDPHSDSLQDEWAMPMEISVGEASTSIKIEDQNRRININMVVDQSSAVNKTVKDWITELIDNQYFPNLITDDITDAIIDWIDKNDDGDAEDDYYERLEKNPYTCRDSKLLTLTELKFIKGITDIIFYGTAEPQQTPAGTWEWEQDLLDLKEEQMEMDEFEPRDEYQVKRMNIARDFGEHDISEDDLIDYYYQRPEEQVFTGYGLVNFLTIHGNKININTALPEVLLAVMGYDNYEIVDRLLQQRIENPFEGDGGYSAIIAGRDEVLYRILKPYLAIKSDYFKVMSTGRYRSSKVRITGVYRKKEETGGAQFTPVYWRVENIEAE